MKIFRNILSAVLGIAAIAAAVAAIALCAHGLKAQPVILSGAGDPGEQAERFIYNALLGDASEAEAMLYGGGSLGLEGEPSDEIGKMLYAALRESFSYEAVGECTVDGTEAEAEFIVTYLDIPAITAPQQELTNFRLAQYLEQAERAEEVQEPDGSFKQDVALKALREVTAELLEKAEESYVQAEISIKLQYSENQWKIIADEDFFRVLSGNAAY